MDWTGPDRHLESIAVINLNSIKRVIVVSISIKQTITTTTTKTRTQTQLKYKQS